MPLFDFSAAITDEAYHADTWKARRPIKVIIGNPPYLAASTNPYDISAYKTETDGKTDFRERKHWLNDDYVKFFRFAEQIINENEEGVLAFVSNNGYLDNPTFRGMRASLLRSFDKIYIVNLHGNANKKEVAPDGGKDENIFDIKQGVSLFIGVKTTSSSDWAKVLYADLWGTRESKFEALSGKDIQFTELTLDKKSAYFIPYGNDRKDAYEKGISIAELFSVSVTGLLSGNDEVAITKTKDELIHRIDVVKNAIDETPIINIWKKFGRGQTAKKIQDDVLSSAGVITPIAYRPFDERWTYYTGTSCGWVCWPRENKTMGHLLQASKSPIGKNIGLVYPKGTNQFWDGAFISNTTPDAHFIDYPGRSITYMSPLYLYRKIDNTWNPNFSSTVLARLTAYMRVKPSPIEVFDYIYGVLYDPIYRERFNEFLKRDFPRVPVINSKTDKDNPNAFYVSEGMFRHYVNAGKRLRQIHLLQIKVPADLTIEPNTSENMEIGAVKYKDNILLLNANKRIIGIAPHVWNYRIGGYQVLDKWFKSHKGEPLTIDRFEHIANIAGLLAETIKTQEVLRKLHESV